MIIKNPNIVKEPAPSTDWRVFGDMYDFDDNYLGTFGPDGTSVNIWWVQQDESWQLGIVQTFMQIMAQQIVGDN